MSTIWARRTVTGDAKAPPLRRNARSQARSLARKVSRTLRLAEPSTSFRQRVVSGETMMRDGALDYKDVGLPGDLQCRPTRHIGSRVIVSRQMRWCS
jgi:hypothetical protein